jgi:5-methylcytosine-specific restriction endonuclease McrA
MSAYDLRAYRRARTAMLAAGLPCWYCGRRADTVDHVQPVSRGGTNAAANLRPACRSCNSRRGNRPARRIIVTRQSRPW